MTISDTSYLIYNAVHSLAHALHEILLEKMKKTSLQAANQTLLLPRQVSLFKKHGFEHLMIYIGALLWSTYDAVFFT